MRGEKLDKRGVSKSNKEIATAKEYSIPWEIEEATAGLTKGFKDMILRQKSG